MPAAQSISQHPAQVSTSSKEAASLEKEAILIEMLLSSLDLRANAAQAGSPMLSYLVDLLVMRAREELQAIAVSDSLSRREPELSEGVA